MKRLLAVSLTLLLSAAFLDRAALAQDAQPESGRKIVSKALPVYPTLASKMNLEGTVKLLVTVAPNGTVKSVEVRGGHPVLLNAAETAVSKWKWIPAKEETKESVEVKFHPE